MAARIVSVAKRVSRSQPFLLQHYGSQDFLCNRSSPLTRPPHSQVKSVPNATEKKELEDFLAKLDLSMEEIKKANAQVQELEPLVEEFRVVAAKLIEDAYSKKLRYQVLYERRNVTRSCVAVGAIVMLLVGRYF
ncbi:hypothetical protein HS088_TW10G00624 [Tripterygium wilfordii]|uniref:Uncharacterized protein n=1 Tax=Tripterygium wilfordii TaxID=458696 RepID=A0A7J7D5K3_TRIWF|nr:uncharacterized protein LOC120007501 [Tripterygium wilfordii]KAF5741620.1 hypothetical protein HS088_TW10G00624 [Tripterygium wilfordii]